MSRDEEYFEFCTKINERFNNLSEKERLEIAMHTTRQQLLTLLQLKENMKDDLSPKLIREIDD